MHNIINLVTDAANGKPIALRSPQWNSVRKKHLLKEPLCRACNGKNKLQVHHIKPFHLFPELELVSSNLVTLCEYMDNDCHLRIGHDGNFKNYNKSVLSDIKKYRIEHLLLS